MNEMKENIFELDGSEGPSLDTLSPQSISMARTMLKYARGLAVNHHREVYQEEVCAFLGKVMMLLDDFDVTSTNVISLPLEAKGCSMTFKCQNSRGENVMIRVESRLPDDVFGTVIEITETGYKAIRVCVLTNNVISATPVEIEDPERLAKYSALYKGAYANTSATESYSSVFNEGNVKDLTGTHNGQDSRIPLTTYNSGESAMVVTEPIAEKPKTHVFKRFQGR